jgi:transposase
VRSCYEAGRDGFWLHRYLTAQGIKNSVVDAASIEVNRRQRRAKSDRLDANKLLSMLLRYHGGEKVWSVVQVPSVADEDRRHLHRELMEVKSERTQHINRIRGLLANLGLAATKVGGDFLEVLSELRTWDEQLVPPGLQARLRLEFERLQLMQQQISLLERQRDQEIRESSAAAVEPVRKLMGLRSIGANSAWVFSMEFFGWRQFRNRRELGSLGGLTPTPYNSGDSAREQGISKSGNRRMRYMLTEIAWSWLHWQPDSALSQWYRKRFGQGSSRQRKIGIVALARKLLVRLWRYLEWGEVPEGALLVDWHSKVNGRAAAAVAAE